MKSCVIQRDVTYVFATAVVFMLLYTFTSYAYGQEEQGNEVTVTIMQGSADAGSGENKYEGQDMLVMVLIQKS